MDDSKLSAPGIPAQRPDRDRPRLELHCIGSFVAFTQDGERHTIEIWTRFSPTHDRNRSRVAPGLIVLTTTEGYDVEHIAKGQYRLHESPEVSLSSDDPSAP